MSFVVDEKELVKQLNEQKTLITAGEKTVDKVFNNLHGYSVHGVKLDSIIIGVASIIGIYYTVKIFKTITVDNFYFCTFS